MADSDDEYDRKRRDKFRGERSSGDSYRTDRRDDRRGLSSAGGGGGGREDWVERNPFRGGAGASGARLRPDYREYRGPRDRFGSPGREMPPAKRMRPDWGDEMRGAPRYGGYDHYLMAAWNEQYASHSMHGGYGHPHSAHPREPVATNSDLQTQPAMLTLKQFLDTQDDGISDSEVLRKYNDYKLDFKRQQLNEFFVAHKDEEWFKNKYHPVDSVNRKEEHLNFLKKRIEVFTELLEGGQIKAVTVDTVQSEPLLRLLDTVVIKLEGGTDEDLKILDEKPKDIVFPERTYEKKIEHDDDVIITSVEKKPEPKIDDKPEAEPEIVSPRVIRHVAASDEENWDDDEPDPAPVVTSNNNNGKKKKKEKKSLKRKRTSSDSSSESSWDSESSSSSSSEEEDEDKIRDKYDVQDLKPEEGEPKEDKIEETIEKEAAEDNVKEPEKITAEIEEEKTTEEEDEPKNVDLVENIDEESNTEKSVPDSSLTEADETKSNDEKQDKPEDSEISAETNVKSENQSKEGEEEEEVDQKEVEDEKPAVKNDEEGEVHEEKADDKKEEVKLEEPVTIDLDDVKDGPQPRALHRTSSIFLRNLAPSITKKDIEDACKRFDGFLRVAIADPLVERRWYRRGWVTFKRDVNIKDYCWSLNNTRLRDCEMGAIVNRDLSRRVRPVLGITAHKAIVRSDIKLCAKIAMNMDEKLNLWEKSNNQNGEQSNGKIKDNSISYGFCSNNPVLQNITDFLIEEGSAEEDELLGITGEQKDAEGEVIERDEQLIAVLDALILYLRIVHSVDYYNHCEYPYEDEMPNRCGIIHARGPPPSKISQKEIADYNQSYELKLQPFLTKPETIIEEDLQSLGCKDPEAEVEKFVQANTQELAKDKWLCPLSGKKFKGPEFIRKHIFNKHIEKVDEVRKEVEYFNNYLRDPKRPQLPEHPGSNKRTNSESSGGYRPPHPIYPPAFAPPYAPYVPPMMMPGRGRGFGPGPARRELPLEHQRRIIGYHDLDAPANFDMFD